MRLMRFSFTVSHIACKDIATADVLSRAPVSNGVEGLQEEEINLYINSVMASLPATEKRLREIQTQQDHDSILQQLKNFCAEGWPDKFFIERVFQPYLQLSGGLTVHNGLLLYGSRIVSPALLKAGTLSKLHEGYLGIIKCRKRAKQSVWWPGLNRKLTKMIENCLTCACERTNFREALLPTKFPSRPWSIVGADLF